MPCDDDDDDTRVCWRWHQRACQRSEWGLALGPGQSTRHLLPPRGRHGAPLACVPAPARGADKSKHGAVRVWRRVPAAGFALAAQLLGLAKVRDLQEMVRRQWRPAHAMGPHWGGSAAAARRWGDGMSWSSLGLNPLTSLHPGRFAALRARAAHAPAGPGEAAQRRRFQGAPGAPRFRWGRRRRRRRRRRCGEQVGNAGGPWRKGRTGASGGGSAAHGLVVEAAAVQGRWDGQRA